MSSILIDTCILIDVSRKDSTAQNRLQRESQVSTLKISTITEMELVVGCQNKVELQSLKKFLQQFTVIQLNKAISLTASQLLENYNLSHGLQIPDSLIVVTAIDVGIPLLSKNQRDYRFITGVNLLAYP